MFGGGVAPASWRVCSLSPSSCPSLATQRPPHPSPGEAPHLAPPTVSSSQRPHVLPLDTVNTSGILPLLPPRNRAVPTPERMTVLCAPQTAART